MNNLQKYVEGNPNIVGANHFAPTNTKVAKNFENTPVPKVNGKAVGSAGPSSKTND